MQAYSDPKRESDPHALPDLEVFFGYRHECKHCHHEQPLFTDYYGVLYIEREQCGDCGQTGTLKCLDTKRAWYWQACFPGCLPDGEPIGPFASHAEALRNAQVGRSAESD